jgi:hypothetical protein
MYKDKEVKKNIKFFFLSMCDVKKFLIFTFTDGTGISKEMVG